MLSRRAPLAALAAVTAALAVAVPAASASAATTAAPAVNPQVCQLLSTTTMGLFAPTQFLGGAALASVLAHAGSTVNCPAQSSQPSQPSLWPTLPW
jgi:hypothetical protein